MEHVLIINLTRMGDLIQTTPVMAGTKDEYPDVKITLLINSAFGEICNYIPFVDRIISFNMDGLIEGSRGEFPNLVRKYRYIEDLLIAINNVDYDCVLNFTHTPVSASLMSLVRSRELKGFVADGKGHSLIKHPWLRYFFNVVPGRIYNPYHLCDIYIKAGGATPKEKRLFLNVPEEALEAVRSELKKKGVGEHDFVIGIQPGASDRHKMWATDRYADLAGRLISRSGAKVIVFGSAGERSLGETIKRAGGEDVVDMVGRTSLKELAAFLKCCNLLISNDSGTMHIATAVGTKVIGISLGAAYFRETGPYGEGHIAIESTVPCHPCSFHVKCQEMICNDSVSVEGVYRVVEMIHDDEGVVQINDSPLWEGMQVYETVFSDDGLLEYVPVIRRPLGKDNFFRHLFRLVWLEILDRDNNSTPQTPSGYPEFSSLERDMAGSRLIDKISSWYCMGTISEIISSINGEIDGLGQLRDLAAKGIEKVSLIAEEAQKINPDVVRIKELWSDVPLIEQEIETIGFTHLALRPIVIYFKFGKESLEGEDVAALARDACTLYQNLINQTSMMIQLIESMTVCNLTRERRR